MGRECPGSTYSCISLHRSLWPWLNSVRLLAKYISQIMAMLTRLFCAYSASTLVYTVRKYVPMIPIVDMCPCRTDTYLAFGFISTPKRQRPPALVMSLSTVFPSTHTKQVWSVCAFSLDIVMDTVITASMIYYLLRSKTTFSKYVANSFDRAWSGTESRVHNEEQIEWCTCW